MPSFWPVLVYGTQFRPERNDSYNHNPLGKADVGLTESLSLFLSLSLPLSLSLSLSLSFSLALLHARYLNNNQITSLPSNVFLDLTNLHYL